MKEEQSTSTNLNGLNLKIVLLMIIKDKKEMTFTRSIKVQILVSQEAPLLTFNSQVLYMQSLHSQLK